MDPQKLIEQFLGGGTASTADGSTPAKGLADSFGGFGGGLAAGGLAGLLLGTKGGRKMAGKAAKLGGLAVLGGLAYKAYSDWQENKTTASGAGAPSTTPEQLPELTKEAEGTKFLPAKETERSALSVKMIQAMIAAAKADGHIDAQEQERIFAKLDAANLSVDEKAFLMDELRRPLDVDAIVKLAENVEEAVEIYAASCIAIDPDDPAEQAYLNMLAARLKLAPELKSGIEQKVAEAIIA